MAIVDRLLVEPHPVEDRCVYVANVDGLADAAQAELVGCPGGGASLNAAAGHPHGECPRVVLPPGARRHAAVHERCAAHLGSPHDEGLVEQTTLLEVGQQPGDGTVDLGRVSDHAALHVAVVVPTHVGYLHAVNEQCVTHTALDHAPCQQALAAESGGGAVVQPVKIADVFWLAADVHQPRCLGLHAKRQFVGADARLEFAVAAALGQMAAV